MSRSPRHRILMIDDDEALGELLAEYLAGFGYQLTVAPTAAAGKRRLRSEGPELLVLDIMLPDADGLELCRSLREESDVPIMMLTARGDLPDRVLGLELGADDYLAKPFEPRELVARIATLLRRTRPSSGRRLVVGDLTLEPESRRVTADGREVALTTAEFDLLQLLMEGCGRVQPRDRLVSRLHGLDGDAYDRSVDMLVSRLRRKLGDDSRSPRWIRTVRGIGYQLAAPTEP